jgi:CubicO group peptidase (beta-lactamase class C family)
MIEGYFDALDERMGRALGPVGFGPETAHDLCSVTKSIVGLLCGIVVSAQAIHVQCPLRDLLPRSHEHFTHVTSALSLEHVLSTSMGLEWTSRSRTRTNLRARVGAIAEARPSWLR